MIAFVTFFLGLVTGPYTVEVVVGQPVVEVEIALDGVACGVVRAEPWLARCDFGALPEPHHLVAVARDSAGKQVALAEQWVNLPQPPARVDLVLERGAEGRDSARLSWMSLTGSDPDRVEVILDGDVLPFDGPEEIPLPRYDPDRLHLLRAEVEFPGNVLATKEMTFGGFYVDEVHSELTAVLVVVSGKKLPSPEALGGSIRGPDGPLRIVAVERGSADLIVVRDDSAMRTLEQRIAISGRTSAESLKTLGSVRSDTKVRFLWPKSEERALREGVARLFPMSAEMELQQRGLFWSLAMVRSPEALFGQPQQLRDGAAVAGIMAMQRNRRRVVLVVLGTETDDVSRLSIEQTRHYLAAIGVPLVVWAVTPSPPNRGWENTTDVSSPGKMRQAANTLRDLLARQAIVWVEGIYLPQQIEVDEGVVSPLVSMKQLPEPLP